MIMLAVVAHSYFKVIERRSAIKSIINFGLMNINCCISEDSEDLDLLAQGYLTKTIKMDKYLFSDLFIEDISRSYYGTYLNDNLSVLLLIDGNRIDIFDCSMNKWIAPEFFVEDIDGVDVYFSAANSIAAGYDANDTLVEKSISELGISEKEKEAFVLRKLNEIIGKYTKDDLYSVGVALKTKIKSQLFNPLDDLTVIAVSSEARVMNYSILGIKSKRLTNYAIVGYTIQK